MVFNELFVLFENILLLLISFSMRDSIFSHLMKKKNRFFFPITQLENTVLSYINTTFRHVI